MDTTQKTRRSGNDNTPNPMGQRMDCPLLGPRDGHCTVFHRPIIWPMRLVMDKRIWSKWAKHYDVTLCNVAGIDNSAGLRMEKIGPVVSEVCILQSLAPAARPERCVNENFSLKPFDDFSAKAWHYNQSGVDIGVTDAFVPVTWRETSFDALSVVMLWNETDQWQAYMRTVEFPLILLTVWKN